MSTENWIEPLEGKVNHFIVDPDVIYPKLLKEMGVEEPNQFVMEIVFGCMKLDSDLYMRLSGTIVPGTSITRLVRSDDGRKERWNIKTFPPGDVDFNKLGVQERSRHIRNTYRRIRGFMVA